jgi:hypothetical protein
MISLFNTSFYLLIVCVFAIARPLPIMDSSYDLTAATPTIGSSSQTPTATSSTPSQTDTPTVTPSITPTTTLMPLPAITLVFPAPTITSSAITTPDTVQRTQTPNLTDESINKSISPRMKVITIALAFMWLFLAVFVIIYIRQFK